VKTRSAEHGFTPLRRSAEHGFTLVELMVSLLIFGILSAAGVALLSFSVRAQAAAKERLDEMAEVRRLGAAMTGDLAQAVPRISRNGLGDRAGAFQGGIGGEGVPLLAFVRSGWSNSAKAARPSLQKVEYRLNAGRLERVAHAMLDGGEAQPAATLFEGIESVRLRYRFDNEWRDAWDPTKPEALPRAVEFVMKPAGRAEIRQVFVVGSGY